MVSLIKSNFGTQALTSTNTTILVMTNSGAVAATSIADAVTLSAPYNFTGTGYPGTGGDCGVSLAAGASCNLEVQFIPSATGVVAQTLTLNFDDGATGQVFTHGVTGTGANPASLTIGGADPFDFGAVKIDEF